MDKKSIQFILKTKEWQEVENYLRSKLNGIKIDSGLPVDEVGKRALAKMMALDAFEQAINEMHAIKNIKDRQNIKYV